MSTDVRSMQSERSQNIQQSEHEEKVLSRDLLCYLEDYAREKPEVAALWCFGIGFVLGWKLKPW